MKKHVLGVLILLHLCLFISHATAQVSASLSGRVTDQTGAAVAGANVAAINQETGIARTTVTNQAGRYDLPALPIGQYELHAKKAGFAEQVRTGILLVVGQDATADLSLKVGQVTEQVKVTANVPMVNATTQDISGLVGEKEVKALPLNGRSYDLLLTLNPGVVNFTWEKTGGIGVSNSTTGNNFSVSGNRPQQNLFLLNGVEFTGAAENNMQPGGPSQNLLGVEAVREFNLLRDSYGAEYGKRPGAQVTIVTQSGTNQWHGSVYEYLRNNALDAPNYFDQGSAPPFQRNQFGAALGGPIQKEQDLLLCELRGVRAKPASDVGGLCPGPRFARSCSPQRSATFEPVADPISRHRSDFQRHRPGFQQPVANHSRGLRQRPRRSHVLSERYTFRRPIPSTTATISRQPISIPTAPTY